MNSYIGEISAMLVAIFWAISSIAFEIAGKKIGSLSVNFIRLGGALLMMSIFLWFYRGKPYPYDATAYNWYWLSLSGFVGFVMGDLFLFKAFTTIGSRLSLLIMNLAPTIAAVVGFYFLDERLYPYAIVGILITFLGISMAIFSHHSEENRIKMNIPLRGFLYALGGALGQALGLILSKKGMNGYDAFAATQIRLITGVIGFIIIIIVMKRVKNTWEALKDKRAVLLCSIGAFFGPFIGVGLSLVSIKYTATGISATIMATTPILLIIPAVFYFKQKITIREMIGAFLSVVGLSLFFIR